MTGTRTAPGYSPGGPTREERCDVLILGGGLAGAATAAVLGRRGMAVRVIDRYPEFPPLFRAEKIEPDQVALLRRLGLFDAIEPHTRRITEIIHARNGRVVYRRPIEQFGISYCDIVNRVRSQIPGNVELRFGVVKSVIVGDRCPGVIMTDGTHYQGRLLVIATGMNSRFAEELGARKRMYMQELSMAFGFMLESIDGKTFAFDAVTYRPKSPIDRIGYLTLFRMGSLMRGNLFAYWRARDPDTREMVKDPTASLHRLLPGLDQVVGPYCLSSKIEAFRIDLYRMDAIAFPGVVVIGDAYQSVCPSTGRGLSKVLTDVDVLCNQCAPAWRGHDRIGADMTGALYRNASKVAVDDDALHRALRSRSMVLGGDMRSRVRRILHEWRFDRGR